MKILILSLLFLGSGDQERGLELYRAGDYAAAAEAFRAALAKDPENAEIAYNLALALWRAGEVEAAETAAEKAATLSGGELNHLRDGILGNLRFDAANVKAAEDLQAALELAERARDNFLRGALAEPQSMELRRNLERAERLIAELEKKIEEQEKQEEEDQEGEEKSEEEQEEEEQKEEDKKEGEQKEGDGKGEEQKDPEQKEQEQKQGEEQQQEPQPKQEDQQEPEPEEPEPEDEKQGQEGQAEPQPQQEEAEQKELSPEQLRRLLDALQQLSEQKQKMRAQMRAQRPKVKKDW